MSAIITSLPLIILSVIVVMAAKINLRAELAPIKKVRSEREVNKYV